MASVAILQGLKKRPISSATLTALTATSTYAILLERETEQRELAYHEQMKQHNEGQSLALKRKEVSSSSKLARHFTQKNEQRKLLFDGGIAVDGITDIGETYSHSTTTASQSATAMKKSPLLQHDEVPTTQPPLPPPLATTLPRRYNRQLIQEYWSQRPVTVASRIAQITKELAPLLLSYVYDFKLSPLLREALNDDTNENDDHDEEEDRVELQKVHAINLKNALTKLGPAFVKMGQQLSIRPDLVPPAVLKELQKLCDAVEPMSDEIAMEVLREELGLNSVEEIEEVFEGVQRVASASLGQVYKAKVKKTNQTVAIKVQRPDMERKMSLDLYLLQCYGNTMDKICDVLTNQIPYHANFMDCFAQGSYMELDYEHEASNQIRFKTELAKRKCRVVVPHVLNQFTSRRVITSEWIDGTKLVDAPRDQIRKLIPVGVELFLTQMLDIGAFHADPHPANLFVTPKGELCLLDFGLCVDIDERSRHALVSAIVNLLSGDFDSLIAQDCKKLGFLPHDMDVTELKPILTKILTEGLLESGSNLHSRKKKLMDISNELNDVFFRYPFSVPPFFALVTRGLGLLEGIALSGDPDFDIFQASYPYARRRAVEIFGSRSLMRRKFRMQKQLTQQMR